MKAVICGGGTAGHVTPGISIAETILNHEPESSILFVGREDGDENGLIKCRGFELATIDIYGFSRSFSLDNAKKAFKAIVALRKAKKILKDFSADIVIGTGGYVCWPVVRAAQVLGIPNMIHESNVAPGMTAKMLAGKCDKVLLNFPGSEKEFKRKDNLITVGNPLLSSIMKETRESARKKLRLSKNDFLILSFGGSGGADILNKNIITLMQNYCTKVPRIKHIHASGKRYYAKIKASYPSLAGGRNGCIIYPFIDDMATFLRGADIVICRCGAMTLSEVAKSGVVPILIPSPNVTDNHQYKNAKTFVDSGAALMIEESELNERTLLDAVRYLENNPALREKMKLELSNFAKNNSRELIYEEIRKILQK